MSCCWFIWFWKLINYCVIIQIRDWIIGVIFFMYICVYVIVRLVESLIISMILMSLLNQLCTLCDLSCCYDAITYDIIFWVFWYRLGLEIRALMGTSMVENLVFGVFDLNDLAHQGQTSLNEPCIGQREMHSERKFGFWVAHLARE